MTHTLKTHPEYFKEVEADRKTWELRKNDRLFKVGEKVILQEYNPTTEMYTGKELEFRIGYILHDAVKFGLKPGYCIFTLEKIEHYV